MKAVVIRSFGGPEVLRYEDVETPRPGSGHILVKILAAGVNRLDHYLREGSVTQDISFPHVLGSDAVGEVADIGEGVNGFEIGDRVVPVSGYPTEEDEYKVSPLALAPSWRLTGMGTWGTYAQFIEVPARWTLKDESGLTPEELATLPTVMPTGVRAVRVVGEVKKGDRVLITAGSSGAGTLAIQVAKALGAEVAATVRDDAKGELTKALGADCVINTRKENLVERIQQWTDGRGVDVAIDYLGGDFVAQSIDAVKPRGIVVVAGFVAGTEATFNVRSFFFPQKQLRGTMSGDVADYQWGIEQVRAGRIRPVLDRVLPLREAAEAHRLIASNQVKGNLVLLPWAA